MDTGGAEKSVWLAACVENIAIITIVARFAYRRIRRYCFVFASCAARGVLTAATPARMTYPKNTHSALVTLQRALTPDELWQAANQLLRAAMPVYHVLIGLPCLGTMPVFLRTTLPVPDMDNYFAKLDAVAPMAAMLERNPGAIVVRLSDQMPPGPLDGIPFYDLFMKPEGWRYSAGLLFWSPAGEFIGQLSLNRTEAQGDITDAEMDILRALHPLANAAVERLLASEKRAAAHTSLEHTVHSLPIPMLGVDWDLAVNYSNVAARETMSAWRHGLHAVRVFKTDVSPKLPADLRAAREELKAAWQDAVQANTLARLQHIRLLNHASEAGFQATVQLIEPVTGRSLQPSFVIQFSLPPSDEPEVGRVLGKLARLTPTEREVSRLTAAGDNNTDISRKLNVSESTVRTHLRNIFRKLGITSRGKLAPLYRSLESR
jgi:DNA-binding CsgD family transcriptional regulator